jgi:hypothetical protein
MGIWEGRLIIYMCSIFCPDSWKSKGQARRQHPPWGHEDKKVFLTELNQSYEFVPRVQ